MGTRLLPATKSQPKEMLPVGRKPVVQHVLEEMERSGVRNLLFVTGRGKAAIENHFDRDMALIRFLADSGKADLLSALDFERVDVAIHYTRQSVQRGLADAILHAEAFTGGESFIVALGDSIIGTRGDSMPCGRMASAHVKYEADVVIAVEEVPLDRVQHYGIVVAGDGDELFPIRTMVEKPSPEDAPSTLAVAGRYVFSSAIFEQIRLTPPGAGGEVQITDAIRAIAEGGGRVLGMRLGRSEKRYDIGSFPSYYQTFLEFALADSEYGAQARDHLSEILEREGSPCD